MAAAYTITLQGSDFLRRVISAKDELVEAESLVDEAFRRFKSGGFALTIRESRGPLDIIAVLPVLLDSPALAKPGKVEEEYLRLASNLYVSSVKEFIGKSAKELAFPDLQYVWRVVDLTAWNKPIKTPHLTFDYSFCWQLLYDGVSEELREILGKRLGNRKNQKWMMFGRLKLWSCPIGERLKMCATIGRHQRPNV